MMKRKNVLLCIFVSCTLCFLKLLSNKCIPRENFPNSNKQKCPTCPVCKQCANCPDCTQSSSKTIIVPETNLEVKKSENEEHYDTTYWNYQKSANQFGGVYKGDILRYLFTKKLASVLEFGSAGGYIVSKLPAELKVGVEVSYFARTHAAEANPEAHYYERLEHVPIPGNVFEVIYTTSVIEHVDCPLCMLRQMRSMLQPRGRIIVGIRNDGLDPGQQGWTTNDRNNHIYTWNELLLGNLLKSAGLHVCGVQGGYTAWHGSNYMQSYLNDKKKWCHQALKTGKQQNVYYIWSVSTNNAEECKDVRRNLASVSSCEYIVNV